MHSDERLLVVFCYYLVCRVLQSMTLQEASVEAMKILKQVMEEKLTSTNIEVKIIV